VSLLVVAGPPGVGKSTVAALVADRQPSSVLVDRWDRGVLLHPRDR
jgi:adenylate kinase family enzyme